MTDKKTSPVTCGCCEGVQPLTPVAIENTPGLSALAYRVGTHPVFKQSMLALLSREPALRRLTTRDDDDPAIALLDGWATVLDVLSFYQERIANEGYLRTATERRSILEMARSIGYELRPGVAAGTYLAFTLETAPGAPPSATVSVGTKAQSVPGQDELPQVFETVEEIEARAEWNELKPRRTMLHLPEFGDVRAYLEGTATNLKPGDPLLVVGKERESGEGPGSERWEIRRVSAVEPDNEAKRTLVRWDEPLGSRIPHVEPPAKGSKVYALRLRAALFGHNAPDWRSLPVALRIGEANPDPATGGKTPFLAGAYAGRENSWADAKFANGTSRIYLDAAYSQVTLLSWIVLASPTYAELYRVKSVGEESKADFNISAKATRLDISGENIHKFSPREATVYAQSEELAVAEAPLSEPVEGQEITLDKVVENLAVGRKLIVSGKRMRARIGRTRATLHLASPEDPKKSKKLAPDDELIVLEPPVAVPEKPGEKKWRLLDLSGFEGVVAAPDDKVTLVPSAKEDETVTELVTLKNAVREDESHTKLTLADSLQNVYDGATVSIYANVARATHGETKTEVIGGGDGSQPFQKFVLKQKPLTYVSAATPSGAESTLEVRVNGVLWEEVDSFYQMPPDERAYITRRADDGTVTVQFGDGFNGTRLPTGLENVSSKYRVGIGLTGMVDAGQISQLMSRPLGVKGVINPLEPTGGGNPEQLDQARRNAPLTVLTLERIVSLQDYEDFAAAFAGIGKAQATLLWSGERRIVHLTIAGADGAAVPESSDLYKNLAAGIDAARHPEHEVRIDSYETRRFKVEAGVLVDRDYVAADVLAAVKQALVDSFSFSLRAFGQAATASEILNVMQGVEGVVAVDLDKLYFVNDAAVLRLRLPARIARWNENNLTIEPSELLTIDPDGIVLMEKTQ